MGIGHFCKKSILIINQGLLFPLSCQFYDTRKNSGQLLYIGKYSHLWVLQVAQPQACGLASQNPSECPTLHRSKLGRNYVSNNHRTVSTRSFFSVWIEWCVLICFNVRTTWAKRNWWASPIISLPISFPKQNNHCPPLVGQLNGAFMGKLMPGHHFPDIQRSKPTTATRKVLPSRTVSSAAKQSAAVTLPSPPCPSGSDLRWMVWFMTAVLTLLLWLLRNPVSNALYLSMPPTLSSTMISINCCMFCRS